MILDAAGLLLLKGFESCRLHAYQDDSGIWTIGWGHTGGVDPVGIITQLQADAFLFADAMHTTLAVSNRVEGTATVSNQFGAMVSLCFNSGSGAFASSTVLRQHRAGNYTAAADAFLMWDKDHHDGTLVQVPGLLKRRHIEWAFYLGQCISHEFREVDDRIAAVRQEMKSGARPGKRKFHL
jgi:lysozyme